MGVTVLPENTAEARLRVRGGKQAFTSDGGWVRPGDWLSMPIVRPIDNKFVGLLAITNDDTNFLALSAEGNYTVDWGDGNTENVSSGVQANHQYTYSAISSIVTNTSVTLSVPASASGTITTSSALLKRSKGRIHGFTVSG